MTLTEEVLNRRTLPEPAEARAIRERAGVTQARLASELGVSAVTISRWECGQRQPRGQHRDAYARLLRELKAAVQ
jgi:DNA-binding transcriptional regulator YiaG